MQLSQILIVCHLLNANVCIFLIGQILMEYFHCLKLWVLVDVSQWVILTETQWAIKFRQDPKNPSLWWGKGFTLRAYHTVQDKKTTQAFLFSGTVVFADLTITEIYLDFPQRALISNVCIPNLITTCAVVFATIFAVVYSSTLWFDLTLKICNTAPRQVPWKKSITTHACTNSVAFLLMIHHTADCIYKGRLSF